MRTATKTLVVVALAALLAAPLSAQEKQKKKAAKEGAKAKGRAVAAVRVPPGIELTAEQKEKVDALNKEFGPKLAELNKKQASIISKEQLQAQREARKAAVEAGKKGAELKAAVEAAVKLSAEQQQQLQEIQVERKQLSGDINTKFVALLTDEQKAQLPGKKNAKGEKKPGANKAKPAAADGEKKPSKKAKAAEDK